MRGNIVPDTTRFLPINSNTFKQFRLRLGWSQLELAERSGYSARLIRKAEAGGMLKKETIEHLAEAMSARERIITPQDLVLDFSAIVHDFFTSFDRFGPAVLNHCNKHFAAECELHCNSDSVPFDGAWAGIDGMHTFFQKFFEHFSRPVCSTSVQLFLGESGVVARYVDLLETPENLIVATKFNLYFQFESGLIERLEFEFNDRIPAQYP